MTSVVPLRGEVWEVDLNPTKGREQAGRRSALIISSDGLNRGAAELVIVLPMTSKRKGIPFHVEVLKPEGGLKTTSYVKAEDVRSISKHRLIRRWGQVSPATMVEVEDRLRIVLDL